MNTTVILTAVAAVTFIEQAVRARPIWIFPSWLIAAAEFVCGLQICLLLWRHA